MASTVASSGGLDQDAVDMIMRMEGMTYTEKAQMIAEQERIMATIEAEKQRNSRVAIPATANSAAARADAFESRSYAAQVQGLRAPRVSPSSSSSSPNSSSRSKPFSFGYTGSHTSRGVASNTTYDSAIDRILGMDGFSDEQKASLIAEQEIIEAEKNSAAVARSWATPQAPPMEKVKTVFNGTPMHKAAKNREWDELLAQAYRDPSGLVVKNQYHATPFSYAIRHGAPTRTTLELMRLNPRALYIKSDEGELPIHLAVQFGISVTAMLEMIRIEPRLLEKEDRDGEKPIDVAKRAQIWGVGLTWHYYKEDYTRVVGIMKDPGAREAMWATQRLMNQ
mmetsp:Transcript_24826/g.68759  ORF Transcript_24826/g.68759 Transcript_24826/m.68759 type:complete len:337 (+) Transcript_24826:183-1193(+)